jgi:hypothetical protein
LGIGVYVGEGVFTSRKIVCFWGILAPVSGVRALGVPPLPTEFYSQICDRGRKISFAIHLFSENFQRDLDSQKNLSKVY